MDDLDLVVVGGGQAGLAASYWAARTGLRHLVLDASPRTGDAWRHRYDSLRLFTPRSHSALPGLALPGDPDGLPTKDELADYLERYAVEHQLPVEHVRVDSVRRAGGHFEVDAAGRTLRTRAVVVATGPFQVPRRPDWAQLTGGTQRHSADYRNPSDVQGSRVLVVGGGNSGAQIAEELALAGRDVTWSCSGPVRFVPQAVLGRNLFWWLDRLGMLEAPGTSLRGRLLRRRGDPVIGGTGLRGLVEDGRITVKPASVGPAQGGVVFADGSSAPFDAVVWCTGYVPSYDFLDVAGALDEGGNPRHRAGHSLVDPRLVFLGLGWLTSRGSGLVGGVGADACRLVTSLAHQRRPVTRSSASPR